MNDDRRADQQPGADDERLGSALGEAVAREADGPVEPPPVTGIAERAAARAKARRVRHGVVGIAAAAALIAGLVTWNTLGGDGGDGTIQVATRPTAVEPAAPEQAGEATARPDPAAPERSEQAGQLDPTDADGDPAAAPAAPSGDESAAPDPQPVDPPAADPDDGSEGPGSGATEPDSSLLTPEELSTGPTLTWTEVFLDSDSDVVEIYRIESVGDGRIVARAWGDAGDQVVVTTDGTTWTTVPTPAGIAPGLIDIAGIRWVVAGADDSGPERSDSVYYSDDDGANWAALTIDVASDAASLPPHCVERSQVTSVLASGERIVIVVETYHELDLHELLVAAGRAPDRDSILYWRYTEDALVVYLGEDTDAESIEVPFDELGLAPGQSAPCAGPDGQHEQRVHVLTSDGTGTEPVGRYDGANTSAISTADGFFITLRTGAGDLLLTSPDGRTWTEHAISDQGYVPVTRGPGGAAWRSARSYDSYSIERLEIGSGPVTAAEFEGLRPGPILTAGPAGVVATAEPIAASRHEVRIAKDGYELRLDQASGDLALWDLAADVAVYRFAAPEIMFRASPAAGIRIVTEDDGSGTLVFEDPDTGEDLVSFTDADLQGAAAQFPDGPGAIEPPTTWIGWSADGAGWGWQNAAEAFGIDTGGIYPPPIELAVGEDFVLARVEVLDGPDYSAGPVDPDRQRPAPRWFIATVP